MYYGTFVDLSANFPSVRNQLTIFHKKGHEWINHSCPLIMPAHHKVIGGGDVSTLWCGCGARREVDVHSVVHKADHLARLLEGVPTRVDGDNVCLARLQSFECKVSERTCRYPQRLCKRVACQDHIGITYSEAVGRRHTSRDRCTGCCRGQEL